MLCVTVIQFHNLFNVFIFSIFKICNFITSVIYLFNLQLFYFPTDDELNLLLAQNSKVINK